LTGALGKRTKFQTFDVSQLVLIAESDMGNDGTLVGKTPETMALNDDTLLESISFTKPKDGSDETYKNLSEQGKLRTIDQCILLAFCLNVKNSNPSDGLTTEQMFPYVTVSVFLTKRSMIWFLIRFIKRVLENPNNWMVHTMALLLRSRLESNKSRTVERSALQLQALVDQMPLEESSPRERLSHIYHLMMPSKWEMEVCL
jgi:hypothetical protein